MEKVRQMRLMIRIKLIIGILMIFFCSCMRVDKRVIMPNGKIYDNPTIKNLTEKDCIIVFLPYYGYAIKTFKDTIFANSYLMLEGKGYYAGELELSENTIITGFVTIVNPHIPWEQILKSLIDEISVYIKVIDSSIINENNARIIFDENIILEIEKEKNLLFCRTQSPSGASLSDSGNLCPVNKKIKTKKKEEWKIKK